VRLIRQAQLKQSVQRIKGKVRKSDKRVFDFSSAKEESKKFNNEN
jgi:hypothetical protein